MKHYAISGVWKDTNGVITDYAIHPIIKDSTGKLYMDKVKKYSKAEAIKLVNTNIVQTVVWNYTEGGWYLGAEVNVVGSYLRSQPDSTVRDNLDNLISYLTIL